MVLARTVANGCERLRTVANGCERLRTVALANATSSEHTLNPQTPRVKREPLLRIREKVINSPSNWASMSVFNSFQGTDLTHPHLKCQVCQVPRPHGCLHLASGQGPSRHDPQEPGGLGPRQGGWAKIRTEGY